ncbi:GNAT family N-acetyltransferase [Erwinia sp. E602]|uniref:GNAT family N-acetyltransferase n=1 Tax=Erwinia sp. E602 TaxID=2675378 RepID=UPI001BA7A5B4|nr:GNAT family protein [Erwinia sp. E602]QUG74629.1 GNAT family N-acetyltransferase [Erwinia sp. E602]
MNIVIRPYEESDAAAFARAVNQSLDTLKPWLLWAHADFTEEQALQWFSLTHLERRQGKSDELGLFAEDGRLLGGAGLRFHPDGAVPCSIGYWVASSEQRKGVARQAVRQLAARAFSRPEVTAIEILAAEENRASRAVAVSVGAALTGIHFGLIVLESGPVSTAVYRLSRPQ